MAAMLLCMAGSVQPLWAQYEGNSPFCHQGGGLLINEISNGPSAGQGNQEYIELLVTPDPANPLAPVNLTGWILDDNNVAASGEGNAAGYFIFGDCYSAVPPGSILVVYNPGDRNGALPPDDPTDADQDGVYIISSDDACMQTCNSNPSTTDEGYCPCADPDAPMVGWQIGLRNQGDLLQVRDACESVVHAISWGGLQLSDDVTSSPVYFRLSGDDQSAMVIRFTNFVSDDWNDLTNYDNPPVSSGQSPGAANNADNADFIQELRGGAFAACAGTIFDCRQADAGDLVAPGGATVPLTLCQGQDLDAFAANYDQADETEPQAPGLNFEYAFLLTGDQGPDFPILDVQLGGDFDFSALPEGIYRVWGFSYIQTNGAVDIEQFLANSVASISDIQSFFACGYDGDVDSLDPSGQVVTIEVVASPTAVAPANPLRSCGGTASSNFDLTTFDDEISGGGSLPVVWYTDANATQMIVDPADYNSGTTTVFARLEGSGCSSNIVPVSLELGADLGATIVVDQAPDCDSPLGSISLMVNSTDDLDLNWNANEWDGSSVLTGLAPGTYSVTVTDASGCRDSASVRLNAGGMTLAEFFTTNPTCAQPNSGSIRLSSITGGTAPYQLSVNGGAFEPSTGWSKTGLPQGVYTIIIRDSDGCDNAQSVTLNGAPNLSLNLGPDLEIEAGDSAFIVPSANFSPASVSWQPLTGITVTPQGIIVHPAETTPYVITATTSDGCSVSDNLTITVVAPPDDPDPPVQQQKIFIPNAFSPNEDGINDTFTVFADEEVTNVKSMRIFDRWGNMLLEQKDLAPNDTQAGWRGELNGRMLPMGVYIYFIELDFQDGHTEVFKGEIAIVR